LQHVEERPQMSGVPRRWQAPHDPFGDARDTDGVALLNAQIAERPCNSTSVFDLRNTCRAKCHRAAGVENEAAPQIGVGLELLHIKSIRPAVDPPVESPQIIAGDIFSILGKLDARPAMRARMPPGDT